ncbi:uncharacterized protein B0I36DRAFT_318726 [Microdochium trichocladiopsis]|uniref:Uncharacterized protein n=1 Tax=Microdochium trichocladiopsis TaxID=1682393 RepID=A0A9P9BTL2_9PEZI|nr:uncharacterized protein B0I36DRAFT_318726 [Microdochium trichocladiopsis]KAH7035612.1 hypothetical protein B0I36DRAFT_318726 [Microdochium trichocladiopsis]
MFLLPHQQPPHNLFAFDNHAHQPMMYNPQQFPMGPGQPGAGAAYSAGPNVMPGGAGPGAMMQNPGAHMAGPNGQSMSLSSPWYSRRAPLPARPCAGRRDQSVGSLCRVLAMDDVAPVPAVPLEGQARAVHGDTNFGSRHTRREDRALLMSHVLRQCPTTKPPSTRTRTDQATPTWQEAR